jgi:hypothetical protein
MAENNPCKIKYGRIYHTKLLLKNNTIYIGSVNINSQRHGTGKILTADNILYEGSWVDNNFNGYGRIVDLDGNIKEGK